MENNHCIAPPSVIKAFLENIDDNWRNTFYIECGGCNYEKEKHCGDFLFVPAVTGQPILLPVHDAELLFDRLMDKSECLGVMGTLRFCELYGKHLSRAQSAPEGRCPLLHEISQLKGICAEFRQQLWGNQ
jgi:hypothetical protein